MRRVTWGCVFLLGCSGIASCTTTSHPVDARESFWTNELSTFFSEPRDAAELEAWLAERGVEESLGRKGFFGDKLTVELEEIEVDSTVCESWKLSLSVFVADDGRLSNHNLKRMGNCL